jgi:two-component system response regulator HydG
MTSPRRILVVDDQESVRQGLKKLLAGFGHDVMEAGDAEEALERALARPPDLVVIDLHLPGRSGLELVGDFQERGLEATLIVLTGHGTIDSAVEATRRGVFDYLVKPVQPELLRTVVDRGLERAGLRKELRELRRELMRSGRLDEMVGRSPRMIELYRLAEQIGPTTASVLITGESGTGKEILARVLHRLSPRATRSMIAVNCAAIPETLLESEIFGHEKGAFTGATTARAGCFEQAHESTLFLDEIGEMPVDLQTKLLRVLEDGKFRRVGGQHELAADVRVIAATNADVDSLLESGRFREDLYFRLNVFTLRVPPLRERPEDIPILAEHFLREYAEDRPSKVTGFSEAALELMTAHDWPGNVRELRNLVQRGMILCVEGDIQPEHLPPALRPEVRAARSGGGRAVTIPVGTTIAEAEKTLILQTLEACMGKKAQAAEILGISLKTLYTRLQKYNTERPPAEEHGGERAREEGSPTRDRLREVLRERKPFGDLPP